MQHGFHAKTTRPCGSSCLEIAMQKLDAIGMRQYNIISTTAREC